jgi:hypothetical protein
MPSPLPRHSLPSALGALRLLHELANAVQHRLDAKGFGPEARVGREAPALRRIRLGGGTHSGKR